MCTLLIGRDVNGAGTIWIGANRDEDPGRPTDPPGVLNDSPRIVGGRDRVAGGTWLAIRERRAVVAMLNRRGQSPVSGTLRSRGLLAIEVAGADAGAPLASAALTSARRQLRENSYAPFSLVFLSLEASWLLTHDGAGEPRVLEVVPGWHVLTHADLDDPSEPRTAWLSKGLADWRPPSPESTQEGLMTRLREHGTAEGGPAVCLHQGRMVTVSSSIVHLSADRVRYLHAEGRPCERPFVDLSDLLENK